MQKRITPEFSNGPLRGSNATTPDDAEQATSGINVNTFLSADQARAVCEKNTPAGLECNDNRLLGSDRIV